ncbi:M3 family oligoendopeptidase [Thalassobacillus hwangdonensis]|uniref:M3 family oligoendopeptidase n=1 Tax=Thalassobacillus hwangdonensis TaxID=546108 RepID=A0ABW3L6L0_9BACI
MSKVYIEKLDFSDVASIKNRFETLLAADLQTEDSMVQWLKEVSDFYDAIQEGLDGHYIDFQAYNNDEDAKRAFQYDQEKIEPLVKRQKAKVDEKFLQAPAKDKLDKEVYGRYIKSKENASALFNKENVQLEIEEDRLATRYFEITGALTADWNGEELTVVQLFPYLEDPDRELRKKAFDLIFGSLLEVKDDLQKIMSELLEIREKKANNSKLANYRDYMFKKYERFDYTPEDCKQLAASIKEHVLPVAGKLRKQHKQELGVDVLRPYDSKGVPADKTPLKPFASIDELVSKTSTVLGELDPRFAELIKKMNEKRQLDLESRKNKSPGGFCTPLPVSESSFIFMNASRSHDDMLTLLHEMGHCIHNDLKFPIDLSYYKDTPMESSELASMSMELLSMDQWHHFYEDEEQLNRAKLDQLKGILEFLPQGMKIDLFQHWMYENPDHTMEERMEKYDEIHQMLDAGVVEWDGYEEVRKARWLFVLHIFEVPFYYVEYVIAQLGAVQMYKQYKEDKDAALENYKHALSLGNTKSLQEIYEAAGIKFDFSPELIKELMEFLQNEIQELESAAGTAK